MNVRILRVKTVLNVMTTLMDSSVTAHLEFMVYYVIQVSLCVFTSIDLNLQIY